MDRPTVLVCDDEADLLTMYAVALKKHYNVLTAGSGKACIEKYMEQTLRGKKINLVLIDYRLGDSTGDDNACKLRELDSAKTILISAYDLDRKHVDDLKARGCIVDVMIKPVSLKALMERVRHALN
jgi:DNA-binding response OmpR family regulator